LGQKSKPSRRGSISGVPLETAVEGDGVSWCGGANEVVMVVGWLVCEMRVGRGFGPKIRNRATVARFRVCRRKRQWKVMGWAGVVVRMR
jgi:hypothetical protein